MQDFVIALNAGFCLLLIRSSIHVYVYLVIAVAIDSAVHQVFDSTSDRITVRCCFSIDPVRLDTIGAIAISMTIAVCVAIAISMTIRLAIHIIVLHVIIENVDPLQSLADTSRLDARAVVSVSGVRGINECLQAQSISSIGLANLLVLSQRLVHLLCGDVVQEDAVTKRAWDRGAELSIAGLQNRSSGFVENFFIEIFVIH